MLSMTGYGNARARGKDFSIEVEIQTYNHRFLDIRIYLPPEYQRLEQFISRKISSAVNRGRVNVRIKFKQGEDRCRVRVNTSLAEKYWSAMNRMRKAIGSEGEISPEVLVNLPGVLTSSVKFPSQKAFKASLRQALEKALAKAVKMRETEGNKLCRDLNRHLTLLEKSLKRSEGIITELQKDRSSPKGSGNCGKKNAFSQDTAAANVEEEVTRLKSHLVEFGKLLESNKPAGKILEFISLEILREVNTLGDKIGNARISREIVFMKNEIESLREQIRNIE